MLQSVSFIWAILTIPKLGGHFLRRVLKLLRLDGVLSRLRRLFTSTVYEYVYHNYNTFSSFTAYLPTTGQLVPLACEKLIHLLNCRDLPVLAQEVVLLVDQGFGLFICLVQFFGDICATKSAHNFR